MYNQEIKGNLARLLATENLVVENRKVSTASFNVDTRVLTLPLWDKASETVYDLLVGHEVGHALYTPADRDQWDSSIPMDYYNVVEDARIEKLIKRRYPGLARDFFKGYTELNEVDFFDIKDKDIREMSLLDRLNLHFKIGAFALVPFQDDEKHFLFMIEEAETFADVTVIVRLLDDFIKRKKEEKVDDAPAQEQSTGSGGGTTQNVPSQEQGENANGNANGESNANEDAPVDNQSRQGGGSASGPGEERSETQKAFDQNAERLNNKTSWSNGSEYVERGKNNIDEIIVSFNDLHNYIESCWKQNVECRGDDIFQNADEEFRQFKSNAQKEVNYLVKEFECKKSADAYARAATSKTGVLDTSKLHTYKYNDDLFKKVTVLPDGKNHGMIFILDWSGSMTQIIESTVKQLINLMWFCRKVQIPFELYAFTYEWNNCLINPEYEYTKEKSVREHLKLGIHQRTSLLNFVSSSANPKDFEKAILNLYRFAYYFGPRYFYDKYTVPVGCDLSGTPLNDAILTLHEIIPYFNKKTGSQKTTVCILTDGESAGCQYSVKVERTNSEYFGVRTLDDGNQLRDRKLGKTYAISDNYFGATQALIQNLKDNFPEVNLVGFRIGTTGDFTSAFRRYATSGQYVPDNIMKKWRKEKSWEFNNVGYDSIYYMANSSLSSNNDFEVESEASKAQITRAFKTMLKSKTTNKKILSSFASVVS